MDCNDQRLSLGHIVQVNTMYTRAKEHLVDLGWSILESEMRRGPTPYACEHVRVRTICGLTKSQANAIVAAALKDEGYLMGGPKESWPAYVRTKSECTGLQMACLAGTVLDDCPHINMWEPLNFCFRRCVVSDEHQLGNEWLYNKSWLCDESS